MSKNLRTPILENIISIILKRTGRNLLNLGDYVELLRLSVDVGFKGHC